MSIVPTTITIRSDDPSPVPIESVVVQFYTTAGDFVTSGTTDSTGEVGVALEEDTYNILFYKPGVTILPRQPQQIVVDALATSNDFSVSGHIRALPESPDPLRCRISGFMVGQDNLPVTDLQLSIGSCPDISVVGGNLVSPQSILRVEPDDRGYFQFDLIRSMRYTIFLKYVDSLPRIPVEPAALQVLAPNLSALTLPSLLFPLPVVTTFSVGSISIPLASGPDATVETETTYSDGNVRDIETTKLPWSQLTTTVSDATVLSAVVLQGKLVLTPQATGTCEITITRRLVTALFWPDPPAYVCDTIVVIVT